MSQRQPSNTNYSFVFDDVARKKEPKAFNYRRAFAIFVISILALGFLVWNSPSREIRLGLDLRGGTTIQLKPEAETIGEITPEAIKQAVSILRQRVDGVGVSESDVRSEGSGTSTRLIVSVPGTTERELVNLVGQTAKLSIRPVLFQGTNSSNSTTDPVFPDYVTQEQRNAYLQWSCPTEITSSRDVKTVFLIACDQSGITKYILDKTDVEGSQVNDAGFGLDQGALGWTTRINFDNQGGAFFSDLTSRIATLESPRNAIAIVLDGRVVTSARVNGPITGGQVQIFGSFTREYASELANVLKYGALPFSFRIDEVQQISATLGASQLRSGLVAGLLGLILISIYLLFYYRALGVLAVGSLLVAFLISYGIFVFLGSEIGLTLTLAGIAGAIVSIGVTADSFIVYFERVRDELRLGSTFRVALERGWLRARRTIIIADAVSLLAAIILYLFTSGNVRGFAFTLGITTLIDLFIVYFFTRPALVYLEKIPFFSKGHKYSGLSQNSIGVLSSNKRKLLDLGALGGRLFRGESSLDVVTKPKRWFLFSGALVLTAAAFLGSSGLNLGLEFKGGSVNVVTTAVPDADRAREALRQIGYEGQAVVQVVGGDQIRVETSQLSNDQATKLAEALADTFKVDVSTIDSQNVGPSWGAEISRKALLGLLWFLIALVIYLAFALEIKMAAAAIVAVVHDVFITVGLYAATGLKVTPAAVIGFLTILGYSLYDTVVVFDKVRENVAAMKERSYANYKKVVNLALNQTLIRSLNTSIVAVIPIASILIVGAIFLKADTLKDISLALVIGQTIGTYSSIFIAAPLLIFFNKGNFSKGTNKAAVESVLDVFTPSATERKKVASKLAFETGSLDELTLSHGPEIFRELHENSERFDELPLLLRNIETLDNFQKSLSIYLSEAKVRDANPLIICDAGAKILGVIESRRDTQSQTAEVRLCLLLGSNESAISDFLRTYAGYLGEDSFDRVAFECPDSESMKRVLEGAGFTFEARLASALALASRRSDKLIFRSKP